ncbi:protein of unknown function DUF2236 [Kalmanozyma brasiliensis GHG001]|uniref:ER-bound oxygenase mpaB/mpaB'/Rubber oxygenase catalytic domain-containing protein n=1 Tax=Kalmanozyma brasiliensis (strain GHG001) TaxID=1365824 RepID=V5GPF6_KALBG|nr:protein of unknown function DUF2236 [Kalmanozyma brasiliensis GHG001]EST07852.1 protein of unknown function DUF2236 [Kalmanozyma brasiliensis GHG001]
MISWQIWAIAFLPVYLACVRIQRFSRYKHIHKRYGTRYALPSTGADPGKPRMIDSYKGVRDAQRIVRLSAAMDVPFVFTKSLEFALFRTYGIPTISSLLLHTGQLGKAENAGRRYVDTAGLIQAFMTYPVPRLDLPDGGEADSTKLEGDNWELFGEDPHDPRSSIALARVNYLHGRWKSKISNDDLLYTLSTFIIEPAKWIDRYEWRPLSALEKEALFALFYHIGRCMGIADIPETLDELMEWSVTYEKNYMRFQECNKEVADHTTNLLMYALPSCLHGFARNLVSSLMDDRLREAMGYPLAPSWVVTFKDALFSARALFIRHLLLARSKPLSNIPIAADEKGLVFSIESLLSDGIPSVCPASGARASDGKTCPVGGHLSPVSGEKTFKPAPWRMELAWYENEPVYSRPFPKGSAGWLFEELRIALGLLAKEDRRGAQRWMPATLPLQAAGAAPTHGLGGFRLEEMGPKGLELKGRKEVLENAEKLHGGKIEGRWAFEV